MKTPPEQVKSIALTESARRRANVPGHGTEGMTSMQRKSTRPAPLWHAEARRLANEGLNSAEIGRRLGRTPSAVHKALNPEKAREWAAKSNADPRRRAQKRDWDRAHPQPKRLPERETDPAIPGLLPVYYRNQIIDFVRVDFDVWEQMRGTQLNFSARRQITGYATFTDEEGQRIYLHHRVLGVTPKRGDGLQTDHINRDSTDNRRANLRLVTPKENCANRGGIYEKAA